MTTNDPYPWQIAHMRRLQGMVEQGRMPHAILFSGPAGVGKYHLAHCLTHQLLLVHGTGTDHEALLRASSHPDVTVVKLLEDKKQISVEQIRELSERLSLTAQIANIKIAIIEPAESMTTAAANALLKTLEEPPGHTLIMLISHNYGRLAPTIRSRCHHVPLGIPDQSQAMQWLESRGVNKPAEHLLLAQGAPVLARQADENAWLEGYTSLLEDLSGLLDHQGDMVSVAAKWRDVDIRLLIAWLKQQVLMIIKMHINGETTSDLSGNLLKNLKITSNRIDLRNLINYAEYLDKSELETDNNLNRELFLEQIFSRWAALSA